MAEPGVICPICRIPLPASATECPVCGEDLAALVHVSLGLHADILYNEGLRLARAGQAERAIDALRHAVGEGHVPAALLLGKLYARAGRRSEARREWERALERDPRAAEARDLLATLDEVERAAPEPRSETAQANRVRRGWKMAFVFVCVLILIWGWALLRVWPHPAPAVEAWATRTPIARATVVAAALLTTTPTATSSHTATAADTSTATPGHTATATVTPSHTATATATPSHTATAAPGHTATATATPSHTPTATDTATATPGHTATATVTPSHTATATPGHTATATPGHTATATATPSHTPTATDTATATPGHTATATVTPSPTATAADTSTATPGHTATATATPAATARPALKTTPRAIARRQPVKATATLQQTATALEPAPVLIDPGNGHNTADGLASYRWTWHRPLNLGECFELAMSGSREGPFWGAVACMLPRALTFNVTDARHIKAGIGAEYYWIVRVNRQLPSGEWITISETPQPRILRVSSTSAGERQGSGGSGRPDVKP